MPEQEGPSQPAKYAILSMAIAAGQPAFRKWHWVQSGKIYPAEFEPAGRYMASGVLPKRKSRTEKFAGWRNTVHQLASLHIDEWTIPLFSRKIQPCWICCFIEGFLGRGEPLDMTTFIRCMPKAELHVHLESTMEPALRLELARRNGVAIPYGTAEEIAATYVYPDIMMWFDIRYEADKVLMTEQDFYDLTYAFLLKQNSQNVVYTEIQYDPQMHMERGLDFGTMISGIRRAQVEAQDRLGVRSQLIWTITREKSAEEAMDTREASLQYRGWLVGIGLASIEEGNPPEKFGEVFRRAQSEGFRTTSHCDPGVEGVVDHIRQCLDLGMDRIDHGQNCLSVKGGVILGHVVSTSSDYVRVMDQRLCQWLLCQANSYPVR